MTIRHHDDTLFADLWLSVRDYIDKKSIEAATTKFVETLADSAGSSVLSDLLNHDDDLDAAVDYYLKGSDEDAEEDIDYDYDDE